MSEERIGRIVFSQQGRRVTVDSPPGSANVRHCLWRHYDSDTGCYETSCGNIHQFPEDGPAENNFHWCPYCGGRLVVEEEE